MAKIEPLHDLPNKKIQQFGIAHKDLSIDELMVPYCGRHSCKQFTCAKPIHFRYKLWVLAKEGQIKVVIVKNAFEVCKNSKHHSVYFDNFF